MVEKTIDWPELHLKAEMLVALRGISIMSPRVDPFYEVICKMTIEEMRKLFENDDKFRQNILQLHPKYK